MPLEDKIMTEIRFVRPKNNMAHIYLSKYKEYQVYNILFGKYQLLNDRGVIDYYSPDLFD